MKQFALVSATLTTLALGATSSSAAIVGTSAVLIDQGTSFPGHITYDVFVEFTDAGDSILSTTGWNVSVTSGSFYNASPTADDPFGLIPDTSGNTPIDPFLLGVPGYGQWNFDTNLSIDNAFASVEEAGTTLTSTSITGGITGPAAIAGVDLMIQIAQITITTGDTFSGVATINHNGGSTVLNVTNVVPAPGALALLGLAGLCGRARRRRS